jgi:hypothetical protein
LDEVFNIKAGDCSKVVSSCHTRSIERKEREKETGWVGGGSEKTSERGLDCNTQG